MAISLVALMAGAMALICLGAAAHGLILHRRLDRARERWEDLYMFAMGVTTSALELSQAIQERDTVKANMALAMLRESDEVLVGWKLSDPDFERWIARHPEVEA